MTYIDPMRLSLSGDTARAQRHVRTARVLAYALVKQNMEGGVQIGRRKVKLGDGTTIEVIQSGKDVTAEIHSPELVLGPEVTMAYVAAYSAANIPIIYIVDVDAKKTVKNYAFNTLVGQPIVSICAHPNGKWLFAVFGEQTLVKIDLSDDTASGLSLGISPADVVDMFMSPDGTRLHLRYTATGIPGSDYFYGGILTYNDNMEPVVQHPSQLFSNRTYRGVVHPIQTDLMYITAFGDADGDTDPTTDETDNDYVPDSVLVYDYSGGPLVHGDIIYDYWLASGRGAREVAIDPKGERAYICSTRSDSWTDPGGPPLHNVPTLFVYDVAEGGLTKITELLEGVELTGCVSTNRQGNRVYVAELDTGVVRWFQRDDLGGDYEEQEPFSYIPEDGTGDGTNHNRGIQHGPKRRLEPDTRMFFLSRASKTLHVFPDGVPTPMVEITFPESPGTFTLGFARHIVPKETLP